jgi:hypothetical protein
VGQDQGGAEDRDRQAAEFVGLAEEDLGRPFAGAVAARVRVVEAAGGDGRTDVGVLGEGVARGLRAHRHGGDEGDGLDAGGEGEADDFRGAVDVGAEQLVVGEDVVDEGSRVDDQVRLVGEALPGRSVQAEAGFGEVPGDHAESARGGRLAVAGGQFGVAGVEGRVEVAAGLVVVAGADEAGQAGVGRPGRRR